LAAAIFWTNSDLIMSRVLGCGKTVV